YGSAVRQRQRGDIAAFAVAHDIDDTPFRPAHPPAFGLAPEQRREPRGVELIGIAPAVGQLVLARSRPGETPGTGREDRQRIGLDRGGVARLALAQPVVMEGNPAEREAMRPERMDIILAN